MCSLKLTQVDPKNPNVRPKKMSNKGTLKKYQWLKQVKIDDPGNFRLSFKSSFSNFNKFETGIEKK